MGWFGFFWPNGSLEVGEEENEENRETQRVRRKERSDIRKEKGNSEKEGEERRKGSKE